MKTPACNSEPALKTMGRAEFKVGVVMNPVKEQTKIHPWAEPEKPLLSHGIKERMLMRRMEKEDKATNGPSM